MLGYLLGSIAVVIASMLIAVFGWSIVDSIYSVNIGVLMEGTPTHLDLYHLCQRLE